MVGLLVCFVTYFSHKDYFFSATSHDVGFSKTFKPKDTNKLDRYLKKDSLCKAEIIELRGLL